MYVPITTIHEDTECTFYTRITLPVLFKPLVTLNCAAVAFFPPAPDCEELPSLFCGFNEYNFIIPADVTGKHKH